MKKINFIAGLPRAGSELLCNTLAQHPDVYVSTTSNAPEIVSSTMSAISLSQQARSEKEDDAKRRVDRVASAMIHSWYDTKAPFVFDKSRSWHIVNNAAMVGRLFDAKVICMVRDMRAILASVDRLFFHTMTTNGNIPLPAEVLKNIQHNPPARIEYWKSGEFFVGAAWLTLKQAYDNPLSRDRLTLVDYDIFTRAPESVMREIEEAVGLKPHKYNFTNITERYDEDNRPFGWSDLHSGSGPIRVADNKDALKYLESILGTDEAAKVPDGKFW